MAVLPTQPGGVQIGWSSPLLRGYYRDRIIGKEFASTIAERNVLINNSFVYARGNNCPTGGGALRIIRLPGSAQFHAYPANVWGPLKNGKLIIPGRTWTQCGIGQGMWIFTATFTPTLCWRQRGWKATRIVSPSILVCNPCTNPWFIPCPCGPR
jgi:hypothetical protein